EIAERGEHDLLSVRRDDGMHDAAHRLRARGIQTVRLWRKCRTRERYVRAEFDHARRSARRGTTLDLAVGRVEEVRTDPLRPEREDVLVVVGDVAQRRRRIPDKEPAATTANGVECDRARGPKRWRGERAFRRHVVL